MPRGRGGELAPPTLAGSDGWSHSDRRRECGHLEDGALLTLLSAPLTRKHPLKFMLLLLLTAPLVTVVLCCNVTTTSRVGEKL